ncbi:hypothetical protein [Arthrobacter sp.]|uniref:hypothetical protein n=1 Tax=Arthrobacter sp. TaxID=1667 RepID=UPI003A938DE6
MELPVGWKRLEAEGCNYLAYRAGDGGTGRPGTAGDANDLTGDAVPVTVQGLDILSQPVDIRAAGLPRGLVPASSIIAVEYTSGNVMQGIGGLYVVDVSKGHLAGFPASRMDLTHRRSGVALFTRRWVLGQGERTLEIAATCPLDHFRRHIQDFDELEDRIHLAA